MNIRYFPLTDRVKKVTLTRRYFQNEATTADFMTKLLQGEKFRQFQNDILNMK